MSSLRPSVFFLLPPVSCLLPPDSVHSLNEDKASRYHRLSRQAAVISLALAALVLGGLLLSGASRVLADAAASWARASPGRFSPAAIALYVVLLGAVQEATAFPLSVLPRFLPRAPLRPVV